MDAEKALYARFQGKTGIAVAVVDGKAGELIKRIGEEAAAIAKDNGWE